MRRARAEEGAWIFVSHSHRDLHSVRRVRDALEAKGHQPLLFFLKCLDDDDEIDDLIRREIEARQFFLVCDSVNACTSRWVQQELRLINDLAGKVSLRLELDADWEAQLAAIDELSRRATVFMSYPSWSRTVRAVAREITTALRASDYRVFFDMDSLRSDSLWEQQITNALDDALDNGYVLLLLSPEVFQRRFVVEEVDYAVRNRAMRGAPSNVVPIVGFFREVRGSWWCGVEL